MGNKSAVREKSFKFAVRTVKLYQHLKKEKKEYVMGKQCMRSGTSIGANVREAQNAESTADFIHKMAIAQKECDETMYWLELMRETDFLTETEFQSMHKEAHALLKMIRSIILTTKANNSL